MTPGAVIVGAHANGLGVLRALAAHGVRTAVVSTRPFDIAQYSRWAAEWHRLPELHRRPESLIELLERHGARWRGWALFPTNDDALTVLARHFERLSSGFRPVADPWEIVGPLVEKDRLHALAAAAGLRVPACYGPVDHADRDGLAFPVVVKPVQHERLIDADGTKLFFARDRAELRAAGRRLAELGLAGLVFEYIPGGDAEIFVYGVYMGPGGEPSAGITIRKLRQSPPLTGSARAAVVVPEIAELREATVALLRRAGLHGMAFAEYKRDAATGCFRFIEVNARPVLFNAVLPPTGIDLIHAAWCDRVLGRAIRPRRSDWSGTWVHLQADLVCSWRHRRLERLGLRAFLAPYRGPRTHAVWSARDPRPFFAQAALPWRVRRPRADRSAA